jgi:hypothetical protein
VIIGEFHFGALDRGMFHPGLKQERDQPHRAELYRSYVQSALAHPLIIGTHWFQYGDQSTTGRGDGEIFTRAACGKRRRRSRPGTTTRKEQK